jgi:hypothetical protein
MEPNRSLTLSALAGAGAGYAYSFIMRPSGGPKDILIGLFVRSASGESREASPIGFR